jgi:putative transposase
LCLDKRATGVRADGQTVLLAIRIMGGESDAVWRTLLDDLVKRELRAPELIIADGAPGPGKTLAALWPKAPMIVVGISSSAARGRERGDCGVCGPAALDLGKWRLKCRAVADSLEEVADRLFPFTCLPPSQWKSIRTSNAIERPREEFKRRINDLFLRCDRNRHHVVRGAAGIRSDNDAQGRRMSQPRREATRSGH